jgi:hypothetical protein
VAFKVAVPGAVGAVGEDVTDAWTLQATKDSQTSRAVKRIARAAHLQRSGRRAEQRSKDISLTRFLSINAWQHSMCSSSTKSVGHAVDEARDVAALLALVRRRGRN